MFSRILTIGDKTTNIDNEEISQMFQFAKNIRLTNPNIKIEDVKGGG